MAYVDTNVFIYSMVHTEKVKEARLAKKILSKIARGELEACTATLTWDELVWIVGRIEGADIAREKGREFLRFPNLNFLPVDGVLDEAQRIFEKNDLRPRDAIHVACALRNGVKEIISDDRDLDKIKEIKRLRLQDFC